MSLFRDIFPEVRLTGLESVDRHAQGTALPDEDRQEGLRFLEEARVAARKNYATELEKRTEHADHIRTVVFGSL